MRRVAKELLGLGAAAAAACGWWWWRRRRGAPAGPAAPFVLPPAPKMLTAVEVDARFGPMPWKGVDGDDSAITIDPAWKAANLVRVEIPLLRGKTGAPGDAKVVLHRAVADRVVSMFAAWERAGLADRIVSWNGSQVDRRIRGKDTVSRHAYGIAFDLNAAANPLGKPPAPRGTPGSLVELVPIAVEHGFTWGGYWKTRPDGMHLEAFR